MGKRFETSVEIIQYPYKIPSLEYLKNQELKDTSSADAWEFLRIEALLRSKSLRDLYVDTFGPEAKKNPMDILIEQGILDRWDILNGSHHVLVLQSHRSVEEQITGQPHLNWGIEDLQIALLQESEGNHQTLMEGLQEQMKDKNSPFLWLQIDTRYPINTVLEKLEKLIKAKQELHHTPINKRSKPYSVDTWIDYFKCYDLRYCQGLPFGEIGEQVYGTKTKGREIPTQACHRVQILIRHAESDDWPPPSGFLNKH